MKKLDMVVIALWVSAIVFILVRTGVLIWPTSELQEETMVIVFSPVCPSYSATSVTSWVPAVALGHA